ncbi:hypothetical protein, partial [Tenacibaculum maritimum]|uniref:hypothetical protein n=1 Tax=Tenacibaculum maritimum TaxID=107401 RepID=UPI001F20FDFD
RNYTHLVEGIVVELSCFKLQKPSSICKYLTVLLSEQDFFSGLLFRQPLFLFKKNAKKALFYLEF